MISGISGYHPEDDSGTGRRENCRLLSGMGQKATAKSSRLHQRRLAFNLSYVSLLRLRLYDAEDRM